MFIFKYESNGISIAGVVLKLVQMWILLTISGCINLFLSSQIKLNVGDHKFLWLTERKLI